MNDSADDFISSVKNEAAGQDRMTGCPLFTPRVVKQAFYEGFRNGLNENARHAYETLPNWPLGQIGELIDLVLDAARENSRGNVRLRQAIRRLDQMFNHGYLSLALENSERWDLVFSAMKNIDPSWVIYPADCASRVVHVITSDTSKSTRRYTHKTSMCVYIPGGNLNTNKQILAAEHTLRYRLFLKGCGNNMPSIWTGCREIGVWDVTVFGTPRQHDETCDPNIWPLSARRVMWGARK